MVSLGKVGTVVLEAFPCFLEGGVGRQAVRPYGGGSLDIYFQNLYKYFVCRRVSGNEPCTQPILSQK